MAYSRPPCTPGSAIALAGGFQRQWRIGHCRVYPLHVPWICVCAVVWLCVIGCVLFLWNDYEWLGIKFGEERGRFIRCSPVVAQELDWVGTLPQWFSCHGPFQRPHVKSLLSCIAGSGISSSTPLIWEMRCLENILQGFCYKVLLNTMTSEVLPRNLLDQRLPKKHLQ